MVQSSTPYHPTPTLLQSMGKPTKTKPLLSVYIVCIHTHSFRIQTSNQSFKRWENATLGDKAEATKLQIIEFLCFDLFRMVELLSDSLFY